MSNIVVRVALATLLSAAPAVAQAADWEIVSLEGPVKVSANGEWRALGANETVRRGAWLKTGTRGTLTLRQIGTQTTVALQPRTQVSVAGLSGDDTATELLQRFGKTTLKVEKRDAPHFRVHTPYLTAIVKGTTLTVNAARAKSWIGVDEGLVEVYDPARGVSTDIAGGQHAKAGQGTRQTLLVDGDGERAPIVQTRKRAPIMPPVGARRPVDPTTVDARNAAAAGLL